MNIIVSIIIVVHDEHNYNNDTQSKYIFKYNFILIMNIDISLVKDN